MTWKVETKARYDYCFLAGFAREHQTAGMKAGREVLVVMKLRCPKEGRGEDRRGQQLSLTRGLLGGSKVPATLHTLVSVSTRQPCEGSSF